MTYTIAIEKVGDIENFDALSKEHWDDFGNRPPQFDLNRLSLGNTVTLRHNGVPVGYIFFFLHKHIYYDEKWCSVNIYYVQRAHRGKGLGASMFKAVEEHAKQQGCKGIFSTFNHKQPLDDFYAKLGFSATHTAVAKEL